MTNASTKQRTELSVGWFIYNFCRGVLAANVIMALACQTFKTPLPDSLFEASVILALALLLHRPKFDP